MTLISIRAAEKEDIPSLMDLIKELAQFEKASEEVTVSLEEFEINGFGEKPLYTCFVADTGNEIIGMALYYIRYSTWKGPRIYLEDLIVRESFRGTGIGKRLFDRCLKETHELGYHGMTWQVLDWNEPAIRFYDKYNCKMDSEWINCSIDELTIQKMLKENEGI